MEDQLLNLLLFQDSGDIIVKVGNVCNLAFPLENEVIEEKSIICRNENYHEDTIPRYSDLQFKEHFRMSRQTFQILLEKVGNLNQGNHTLISLEKKLLFTIWLISKPESFLAAGDRFGLSKSSGHKTFYEIIDLIFQLMGEYIKWPEDHSRTMNVFRIRSRGIPGIVGVIDGCHIPIKQPEGNVIDYFNRKQFHSIILQGICNERAIFTDINVGQPGRMHDARVFRLSPIYEHVTNEMNPLLSLEKHLIGDSAYPLLINVMKPYQDNGHLTLAQQNFNIKLSSVRSTIERAFGLLKGKFRKLKYVDVCSSETASRIVGAACILHNFIITQNNDVDGYIDELIIEDEEENADDPVEEDRGAAEAKRIELVNLLQQ